MTRETVREKLLRLKNTIIAEREFAKQLDLQGMFAIMEEKEALIQILDQIDSLHPEDRKIAKEIQDENRRNAYLFRSTLNWIQETMEFFGKKSTPATYGQYGNTHSAPVNGRLLSGHI